MTSRHVLRALFCLALLGCAEVRESGNPTTFSIVDAPPGVSVYFDRDIQRVFSRSCTGGCHEPGGSGDVQAGLDLTEGVAYAELLDATRSRNGPQVVADDADNSILMWKIEGVDAAGRHVFGDPMPLGRSPLSGADIAMFRTWIAEGALHSSAPPSPPRVLFAAVVDSNRIEITFDSEIDAESAAERDHFSISGEGEAGDLTIFASEGLTTERLRITSQTLVPGTLYTVTVVGLRGGNGLAIAAAESATVQYRPIISLAGRIQPLLDRSCAFVGCHAADDRFPPGAGLVLTEGNARQNLVDVPSVQRADISRITAGNPDASYLANKLKGTGISGDRMPVGGPFLTGAEIQAFILWIEQGALAN